jgi:hypothetical protein
MGAVTTEQQKLVLNSFAMVLQNNSSPPTP